MKIKTESPAPYNISALPDQKATEDSIIARAAEILEKRWQDRLNQVQVTKPDIFKAWLRATYHALPYEVFGTVYMDHQHRYITHEELFRGTATHTSVYSREVVKAALAHNAVAVIFYHNHPGGDPGVSSEDVRITQVLKNALELVEVRVLDHFVASLGGTTSMVEQGLL